MFEPVAFLRVRLIPATKTEIRDGVPGRRIILWVVGWALCVRMESRLY